eukprot:TRINITY_DN15332_c0_g1_i1.p1 TRINITY_DN15332_c0_g1~~TRINITY_DN15332_c0_g1_i1.p1  ORF type:complete len:123 (-),score=32.18 TRINITY_DN15332_c0_g1_i1:487-855(-)
MPGPEFPSILPDDSTSDIFGSIDNSGLPSFSDEFNSDASDVNDDDGGHSAEEDIQELLSQVQHIDAQCEALEGNKDTSLLSDPLRNEIFPDMDMKTTDSHSSISQGSPPQPEPDKLQLKIQA